MLDIKNPLVNEGRFPSNVFVVGNGFDLDLGIKSSYWDFAKSPYWPQDDANEAYQTPLKCHLESSRDNSNWFDLERELYNYANDIPKGWNSLTMKPKRDIAYYKKLHTSLCSYLNKAVEIQLKSDSAAAKVLKAIVANGTFTNNYSFNYTDLNVFLNRLGVETKIEYTHIHGKLADNSIILGVDEKKLMSGYEQFHKTRSPYYRSNKLQRHLLEADEVVFFGVSFSDIDFMYFDKYVEAISDRDNPYNEFRKVTIFTKDESSRSQILDQFNEKGIKLLDLFQTDISFIRVREDDDKDLIDKFVERIDKHQNVN